MNTKQFTKHAPGKLVRVLPLSASDRDVNAFVPDSLPPNLTLTPPLFTATTAVANALGRLQGIASGLPDPRILIRSFVRRGAQLSSYIENTFADYESVAAADQDEHKRAVTHDVLETLNAERAIEAGVAAVFSNGYPITNNRVVECEYAR